MNHKAQGGWRVAWCSIMLTQLSLEIVVGVKMFFTLKIMLSIWLEQDYDEKARVIKLAADLIRSDIKDLTDKTDTFFSFHYFSTSTMLFFVPETLQFFICSLCAPRSKPKDVKIAAIGQALIKFARPNTILCSWYLLLRCITKVVVLNLWYNYCIAWALALAQ